MLHELGPAKIKIVGKPEDLALECNVIFTNLANDDVVKSVYKQFHAVLKDPTSTAGKHARIFVETSTIYPALAGNFPAIS